MDTLVVTNEKGEEIGNIINVPCDYDKEFDIILYDIEVAIKLEALIELIQNNEIPPNIDFSLLPV